LNQSFPASAFTSSRSSTRHLPISSFPIRTGPIAVRTSFRTLLPTASSIRRTCRLRPSVIVISRKVLFSRSRSRVTTAGRVHPSSNSTPLRSRSICSSSSTPAAFTM
jgi:hypothetical protein